MEPKQSSRVCSLFSELRLPVEIWATVFRKLSFEDWRKVRLVSRGWKNVLDGDRLLMSKLILKVPSGPIGIFSPLELGPKLPASTVVFENSDIIHCSSWWTPQISVKLAHLELKRCLLHLEGLLQMLRQTPNLVTLSLIDTFEQEVVSELPDFQLEKMEKLILGRVKPNNISKVFSRICPRLKDFTLLSDWGKCYREVLGMIDTVPSLEGISLVSSSNNLSYLEGVNHQFRRVSIKITSIRDGNLNESLIKFSHKQPLLESFNLQVWKVVPSINSLFVTTVVRNFLKLKRLSIRFHYMLSRDELPVNLNLQALVCLTELEHLTLCGVSSRFDAQLFVEVKNLKLKELFLSEIYDSDYSEYIANVSNLRALTVQNSHLESWTLLFTETKSRELRRLILNCVSVYTIPDVRFDNYLDGLQYLKLDNCHMMEESLSTLFGMCPRLEELHLTNMDTVSDDVVLVLCQKLKQLRKLTIRNCRNITDASVRSITEHSLLLEHLTMINCERLTTVSVTLLNGAQIATVDLTDVVQDIPQPHPFDDNVLYEDLVSSDED